MKQFFLACVLISIFLSQISCKSSRYITEQYIKNNIEDHQPENTSSIRTYSIFKGNTANTGRYLELTGYKFNFKKGLVIGADRSYITRKISSRAGTITEAETYIDYIQLDLDQCSAILTNYKTLQDRLKKEKPRSSEEVYHDYTVSKDCFISFRKSGNGDGSGIEYVNFWVKGEKYRINTNLFVKKLKQFLEY
ncbi:hypothetical protein [Dyadobacter crusticola]|uniref:hypothetical protein n=1 Tax=Dyadobacter crusticola TaxID=292407 RepID=UPI0004E0B055|nr:hypothetical protein [Dyadobacter crusticola]